MSFDHPPQEYQYKNLAEIRELVEWDYKINGVDSSGVKVKFNFRLRTTMGRANRAKNHVEFAHALWNRATVAERKQTIVHEACHLIAFQLYGSRAWNHGPLWQSTMIKCGYQPERCHKVDTTGLRKKKTQKALIKCACRTHTVSKTLATRIANGTSNKICIHCRTPVKLHDE